MNRHHRRKSAERRPRGRLGLLRVARLPRALAGLAVAAALLAGLALSPIGRPVRDLVMPGGDDGHRAAIVDQLSLTYPNAAFVESAMDTLRRAGYKVDYYPGEAVTVEAYRSLPKHDYDVVILRVHAGLVEEVDKSSGTDKLTDYVSLFTGEPYTSTKYVEEVQTGPLGIATYYDGGPQYFGVGPKFIESSMKGRFHKTTVILMGCDGLKSDRTAKAFLRRGAATFISWDQPVSADHTDAATERLLRHLLLEELPAADAVAETMAEVGPDPTYHSQLRYYPLEEHS